VGSKRDILAIQTKDNYFLIGPNNGLFSYFQLKNLIAISIKITELDFFNPPYADALKQIRNRQTMTKDLEKSISHSMESRETEKEALRVDENGPSILHPDLPPDLSVALEDDSAMNIPGLSFLNKDRFVPSDDDFDPFNFDGNVEDLSNINDPVDAQKNKYASMNVAQTFHGRDIMMPVAAHLAKGLSIFSLGDPLSDIIQLDGIEPEISDDRRFIYAKILYIDSFGNIITNIPIFEFQMLALQEDTSYLLIYKEQRHPLKMVSHFEGNALEDYLLIIGSSGFLEICQNQSNAAENLQAHVGISFQIEIIGSAFSEFFQS
jgi:S-adenosylmethionine hydrolase